MTCLRSICTRFQGLRAPIEARGIALPGAVGGREQPKGGVRGHDPILIEQGQTTLGFQQPLGQAKHPLGVAKGIGTIVSESPGAVWIRHE